MPSTSRLRGAVKFTATSPKKQKSPRAAKAQGLYLHPLNIRLAPKADRQVSWLQIITSSAFPVSQWPCRRLPVHSDGFAPPPAKAGSDFPILPPFGEGTYRAQG